MRSDVDTLRAAYRAFNARDVEAALELMHPEVEWPNAWEGGRVIGREAVRAYWTRQFESIQSTVEPERFDTRPDGTIAVTVRQTVRDAKPRPCSPTPESSTATGSRRGWSDAWTSRTYRSERSLYSSPRLKRLVTDASTLVSGITARASRAPPCVICDAVSEMSVETIICPRC